MAKTADAPQVTAPEVSAPTDNPLTTLEAVKELIAQEKEHESQLYETRSRLLDRRQEIQEVDLPRAKNELGGNALKRAMSPDMDGADHDASLDVVGRLHAEYEAVGDAISRCEREQLANRLALKWLEGKRLVAEAALDRKAAADLDEQCAPFIAKLFELQGVNYGPPQAVYENAFGTRFALDGSRSARLLFLADERETKARQLFVEVENERGQYREQMAALAPILAPMAVSQPGGTYRCGWCAARFDSESDKATHQEAFHPQAPPEPVATTSSDSHPDVTEG